MQGLIAQTEARRFMPVARPMLALSGHLPRERVFALSDLLKFERHDLGPTQVNCFTGRPVVHVQSFAGVRLRDVLDDSGFSAQPRSQLKRCVIVAAASDGHRAAFSWSELYNTAVGDGVLILFERNGCALDGQLGPLSLISTRDHQLGPRNLRQLHSVHMHLL